MKYFVTGGCGFIGSHMAEHLLKKDHASVTIYDNLCTGNKSYITSHSLEKLNLITGDLLNFEQLCQAIQNHAFLV